MSGIDRWDHAIPPWVAREMDTKGIYVCDTIPEKFWDDIVDFPVKTMVRSAKLMATVHYIGKVGTTDSSVGKQLHWKHLPIIEGSKIEMHNDPIIRHIGTPGGWEFTAKVISLTEPGYEGIKEGYPRVPSRKLAAYISLFRPFTLVAPFLVGIFGVLIERTHTNGSFNLSTVLLVAICIALFQAIGQISNQVSDINIDRINKPYRPIVSGAISEREASFVFLMLILIAGPLAVMISEKFGLLMIVSLIFALSYSFEPIRVKSLNEWVALFWMSFSRGFIPFLATWSVYGDIFSTDLPWKLGVFAFLWVFAFQSTKDFGDMKGDSLHDIPTLPTIHGQKDTIRIMSVLAFSPFIFAIFSGIMYLLLLIPVGLLIINSLQTNLETKRFENNPGWIMFYLGLGLIYIITLVSMII
jgi:4-hydroxybenzoate polyprenyltransferase